MSGELEFWIEGPEAEDLAREIGEVLQAELGVRPTQRTEAVSTRAETVRSDPMAVAACILAVPGALLAAADLAERLLLKEKLERLLRKIRKRTGTVPRHRVEVLDEKGRGHSVDRLESDELLEIAIQVSIRVRRQGGSR